MGPLYLTKQTNEVLESSENFLPFLHESPRMTSFTILAPSAKPQRSVCPWNVHSNSKMRSLRPRSYISPRSVRLPLCASCGLWDRPREESSTTNPARRMLLTALVLPGALLASGSDALAGKEIR